MSLNKIQTIFCCEDLDNISIIGKKYINNRVIKYKVYENILLIGRDLFYPNVLLLNNNDEKIYSPYDEKIMSLNKSCFYDNNEYYYDKNNMINNTNIIIKSPIFFFIYNFDNYYHYLYDTIPYLWTFLFLKKTNPNLKILINYPNKKYIFYKFNLDILYRLVNKEDIIIHDENNIYSQIFVSSSLTHGGMSNYPPRSEIYELYEMIKRNSICINPSLNNYEKIYISRRTWVNNDTSNIGTNYTTRRKMMNEDILVEELTKLGIKEIFTENLSIDEKVQLFATSRLIIGNIGGGMTNLLFSNKDTRTVIINTPHFLKINNRVKYSIEHTNFIYFNEVETYKEYCNQTIPLFCRVKMILTGKYTDKIGEIIEYDSILNKYKVNISNNDIAGFNNDFIYDTEWFTPNDFILLDEGLNSPYLINIDSILGLILSIEE
jgi:hypothetical protein